MRFQILVVCELELDNLDLEEDILFAVESPGFNTEFEVNVSGTEGIPAKVSGPPEGCYPAEGPEWEVEEASFELAWQLVKPVQNLLTMKQIFKLVNPIRIELDNYFMSDIFDELVTEQLSQREEDYE